MTSADLPDSFGAWVRTHRRRLDLTQAGLGERAGCSEAAIRKIEANERKPSRQLAELLARALEIPAAEYETFLQFGRGIYTAEIKPVLPQESKNNLPTLLTSTINRIHDLSVVTGLLARADVHLVTLVGPPGIGKTRLSIHCGSALVDQYPDGVWFVELADVSNPDFFIPTLARTIPTISLPPSPGLKQLLGELRDKTTLLILDNFEQIVEKSALDVAQILKACPRVNILVTSRVPLHIYGESEYSLPPLSFPPHDAEKTPASLMQFEAVQLFTARLRQHQPSFEITPENAPAIIEICAILEGIPLALELAAASLRQMTLAELARLLRGQGWVSQVATPARDLPQRQRTLENLIAWSYTLLDERQQEGFCRLGVFSNWFDAEAATAICERDRAATLVLLNALDDHSLLECEIFNGKKYWRMLELIHAFAISRLDHLQREQVELLRVQHFMQRLARNLKTPAERDSFFKVNYINLRAALQWTIAAQRVELAYQFSGFLEEDYWSAHGYFREGLEMMRELLELPGGEFPALRANRLQTASDFAWQQHDFDTAITYSLEAVDLGRRHGLAQLYPGYLNRLGRIYIEQGRFAEGKQALQEALALAYQDPGNMNPGIPLAQLGELAFFQGEIGAAREYLEKALNHLSSSNEIFLAIALTDLAEISLTQNDFAKARTSLQQAFCPTLKQSRRLIVFLAALVGYLVLSPDGDKEKAASFLGAIAGLRESSGVVLSQYYIDLNEKRSQLARSQLPPANWDAKFSEGRLWEWEALLAQIELALQTQTE
ncbi:MAG: helix-turn-helix domain-containing protein [Anaerolineales bacterium]|jgi:predicted ATPase/DNA-binding XRE family transcriptional regulator|nr:helix-turn-helix domain-containing protein [Anaerolineales bacterium]